jgi:predicted transcriptional regulator
VPFVFVFANRTSRYRKVIRAEDYKNRVVDIAAAELNLIQEELVALAVIGIHATGLEVYAFAYVIGTVVECLSINEGHTVGAKGDLRKLVAYSDRRNLVFYKQFERALGDVTASINSRVGHIVFTARQALREAKAAQSYPGTQVVAWEVAQETGAFVDHQITGSEIRADYAVLEARYIRAALRDNHARQRQQLRSS